MFLGDFELPHMIVLSHVLQNAPHNHNTILVVAHFEVDLCRLSHFLDEKRTCNCQDKREAKVRVELFFFKSSF
jgi:hypothetical protein